MPALLDALTSVWSGAGLGDCRQVTQVLSAASGGGLRVGVEDSIRPGRGEGTARNAEPVARAHAALQIVGRGVMTPPELRARLGLR